MPDDASKKFYDLLWPHRGSVLRTAQFLARDPHEAADLAQDTMMKAFRSIDQFREGTNAGAWMISILRHLWIDRMRSPASRRLVSIDNLPGDVPDESDAQAETDPADAEGLLQQFSDPQVIAALRELPEEIRWTLLLVDVESMDHAQAAAVLDIPVGTVKSRTHRGRRMLWQRLHDKAVELRMIR